MRQSLAKNHGVDLPSNRLFRLVTAGLHPSVRAKLEYPAPLTLSELFIWYEKIVPTISPEDEFRLAMLPPEVSESCIAEEQLPDLTIRIGFTGRCFKCGQPGHLAWQCKQKRVRALQGKSKNRKKGKGKRHTKKGDSV